MAYYRKAHAEGGFANAATSSSMLIIFDVCISIIIVPMIAIARYDNRMNCLKTVTFRRRTMN